MTIIHRRVCRPVCLLMICFAVSSCATTKRYAVYDGKDSSTIELSEGFLGGMSSMLSPGLYNQELIVNGKEFGRSPVSVRVAPGMHDIGISWEVVESDPPFHPIDSGNLYFKLPVAGTSKYSITIAPYRKSYSNTALRGQIKENGKKIAVDITTKKIES